MSETEQETTGTPTEPDTDTDVPFEEPDEPDEQPQVDDDPDQTEGPDARDDADVDPVYSKLETKAKNYTKALADLLDGSGIPVAGCEMCADCYPGLRWQVAADELHSTLLAVVGAASGESPLEDDPDAKLCDRCNGFGHTKLPSHVPGNDTRLCRQCNGAGWLDRSPQSGTLQAPTPEPVNGSGDVLPGVPVDDASVIDLRSRGFTVIPPVGIAVAETEQP